MANDSKEIREAAVKILTSFSWLDSVEGPTYWIKVYGSLRDEADRIENKPVTVDDIEVSASKTTGRIWLNGTVSVAKTGARALAAELIRRADG